MRLIIKKLLLTFLAVVITLQSFTAFSLPAESMIEIGRAKFKYLFWHIYDARLLSNGEFQFPATKPFALEFTYAREIKKSDLINETYKQWNEIGKLQQDQISMFISLLEEVLVDVERDDVVTLLVYETGFSSFYLNDSLLGEVNNQAFTHHFASIWLSEDTTKPSFRNELLNIN